MVTEYVPGAASVCTAAGVKNCVPSENMDLYCRIKPSGSREPAKHASTALGETLSKGATVATAVGGKSPGSPTTSAEACEVAPFASMAWTTMWCVPTKTLRFELTAPRSVAKEGAPSICTSMRLMGLPEFAEATIGVGQLTVAVRAGLRMLTPGAAALASTRVAATADAPRLSTTVAVTVKSPTCA